MFVYNILDYSHVVITTMQAPSLFEAFTHAINTFGHYYNVYVVKVS